MVNTKGIKLTEGSYVAGDWTNDDTWTSSTSLVDNILNAPSTNKKPKAQSKVKKKASKAPKATKDDYAMEAFGAWEGLSSSADLHENPIALTEKMMIETFKTYGKGFVVEHSQMPSPEEMVEIGAKVIHAPKKKKQKVPRIFKMSDFKFPPVKRVNTQLARKTLKVDLGADILEDIGGLKI